MGWAGPVRVRVRVRSTTTLRSALKALSRQRPAKPQSSAVRTSSGLMSACVLAVDTAAALYCSWYCTPEHRALVVANTAR